MFRQLLTAVCLLAPLHAGITPVLNLVEPRGGTRGTEMEIHFHGERLDGLQEVLAFQPGIEFGDLAVENDKHATAKIRILPDAPLGEHGLRLRTTGGVTFLRSFFVGEFPVVHEEEPNDDPERAQRLVPGTTVQGVAKREDADHYVCSLKKGERFSAEVEAMRLGRTMFDASVAILDPRGFEIASCDDSPLLRTDPFVSIIVPEDGDYRIVVREAAYEGDDSCQYRLHVGSFTRPTAAFPAGARPGETVEFRFIGDPAGEFTGTFSIPSDASGLFPLHPVRDGLHAPSPVWIRVSPLPSATEVEPNRNARTATRLPEIPCAADGIVGEENDSDFFAFQAKKGENLTLKVHARSLRSPLDSVLSIRDGKGSNLANNDDQGGPDSILQWTVPEDGEYFAVVRDQLRRGGPGFVYRLEINRREPAIGATLPVVERNNSQKWKTINVPRGNRYAAVVNVTRENIGCDIALSAESLPQGVTMDSAVFHRSVGAGVVIFESAADAPVAGGLHRFKVSSTGDAPPLEAPLRDTIHHVEINNQGPYHSAETDRVAVAVIDEVPFHLELEEPTVPLVKNGSMHLKVRAIRREGWKEPVQLRFLWNPPGIGSPATITLPAEGDEALYEINANGDAPPGEWRICVLGEANAPEGPVLVSTRLVTLRVAEPYLGMSIDMAATEQGRPTTIVANAEYATPFEGEATAELIGLPHGATAEPLRFVHGQAALHFPVAIAPDAAIGKHTALFCKVTVPGNGGAPILHQVGHGGTLRIDKPAGDPPPPEATAKAPEAPAEKPLSRLEQLRKKTR